MAARWNLRQGERGRALGKSRIFTNWADIETPLGVSIQIDSLGTGALGASGHEAWVDNHFAERFGGAILLSFVDDALGALSAQASKNGNSELLGTKVPSFQDNSLSH